MLEYQRMIHFTLPLWCASRFSRQRLSDFLCILQLEESAVLSRYGTPAEIFIIHQGDHLRVLVISQCKQIGIF